MGCSKLLSCAGLKSLQCEHSRMACLQSVSIPGQKNVSHRIIYVWSASKCPMLVWQLKVMLKPWIDRWHSVYGTLSVGLVLTFHSLLFLTMNPSAQCAALCRSARESPADFPNKCHMMGMKKMSPLNVTSSGCVGVSGDVDTNSISFMMPFNASQSGSTDQVDPSVCVLGHRDHILLRPSATGLLMRGWWWTSIMLYDRIASIHLLWCMLSLPWVSSPIVPGSQFQAHLGLHICRGKIHPLSIWGLRIPVGIVHSVIHQPKFILNNSWLGAIS